MCALVMLCRRKHALPPLDEQRLWNIGCSERLSRYDMAAALAEVMGCDPALVVPGSAASVVRACATPADISMDCSKLEQGLPGMTTTPFRQALQETFGR